MYRSRRTALQYHRPAAQPSSHRATFAQRPWSFRLWLWGSYQIVGLGLRLLYRLESEGVEHVPSQGGVVIVSNHISLFDTLVIPYMLLAAQGVHIVRSPAKEELFQRSFLGGLLTSWGAFPVRRGKADLRAMRQMRTFMCTEQMMLFPEGTRSADGRLQAGKRMVGKLIYDTRPVVIPTAIMGTDGLVPAGSSLPRLRTPVLVRYGRPLDLERHYALPYTKAAAEAIVQEIMGAIAVLLYNARSQS